MSAIDFARKTLFDPRSPACCWKHPRQALRLVGGALGNILRALGDKLPARSRHACPVCGWEGRSFRTFLSADEIIPRCICPGCGSFDRHRHLVLGLRRELAVRDRGARIVALGFSLSPAMREFLAREGVDHCFRVDVDSGDSRFSPDLVADLRRVPVASGRLDWVFCSHVLEHVPELDAGVDEILRILGPGGTAWLQVPFEPGLTRSRRIPVDPHRAHAHAWQFGPDFGVLVARTGWTVTEHIAGRELAPAELERFGIDPGERYWIARKDRAVGSA